MVFGGLFSYEELAEEKKEKSLDYYGRTAEKSHIALRREKIAMEEFKEVQEEMEKRTDLEPGSNHIIPSIVEALLSSHNSLLVKFLQSCS